MPCVLVSGANRGLGLEFVRQYLAHDWDVVAVCRDADTADALKSMATDRLVVFEAELTEVESIVALAAKLDDRPIDVLINNAGVFGPKRSTDGDLGQSFGHIDYDAWLEVLRINTLAPVCLVETLLNNVRAGAQKKIVTVSSRMGSIADGGSGYFAYRSSKTAVNMAMATVARETQADGIACVVVNPGWVKTDMGGATAPLEIADSVRSVRAQIAKLTPADSGLFIDYDGTRIPW